MGVDNQEIMVPLADLIDCAVGHPEVGAVNFNVLHAIMHIMAKQLNLTEIQVQFTGDDAERMKNLLSMKPLTKNLFTDFIVNNATNDDQSGTKTVFVTGDKIAVMEKELVEIQIKMDNLLSTANEDVLRQMDDDKDLIKPGIANMWSYLHITQRIQAVETGIEKITNMFEDVTEKLASLKTDVPEETGGTEITNNKINELFELVQQLQKQFNSITGERETDIKEVDEHALVDEEQPDLSRRLPSIAELQRELEELKNRFISSRTIDEDEIKDPRHESMDNEIKDIQDKLQELDRMVFNQTGQLNEQISELEREIGILTERVNAGPSTEEHAPADPAEIGGLTEIYSKLRAIQEQMDHLSTIVENLQETKEERVNQIDNLTEAIEYLKIIKADKEDLEDALADKADQQALNRKVSHNQFDAACDDLSKSLEDALCKLGQQEALWKQALESIQFEIGQKLDKGDLDPLREFINVKLKSLQDRVRTLTDLKRDTEAAGTKSKLLRNVNCISCDKNAMMRRDLSHPPVPSQPPLPAKKSLKPYLTYELDTFRRQAKKLPERNLNDFEALIKEDTKVRYSEKPDIVKTLPTDHICNRYCGGSHTIITPQQRVTHLGNFLKQWGLEIKTVNEGYSKGTDGKLYKIREEKMPSRRSSKKGSPASSRPSTGRKDVKLNSTENISNIVDNSNDPIELNTENVENIPNN